MLLALTAASCGGQSVPTTTALPVTTTAAADTSTTAAETTTTVLAYVYPYDFAVHPAAPVVQPEDWDQSYTAVPWVILRGAETLLFYAGASGRAASLGLATSSDGITFEKHPDNPLFAPPGGLGWFSIAEVDDQWVMWYVTGFSPPYRKVNRATAPSLRGPWTDEGESFIAPDREWDQFIVPTGVTDIDGTLFMPYAGYDQTDRIPAIGLLTSTDGVTWEPIGDDPIHTATEGTWDEKGVVPTNIIETERGLELFFLGFDEAPKVGYQKNSIPMGRLVSTDGGESWLLDHDGLPVADTEERGWPGVSVAYVDGEYRLYLGDDLGGAGISLITGTIP